MPEIEDDRPAGIHRKHAEIRAGVAVITLSSTRSLDEDRSGDIIQKLVENHGHRVAVRRVIPDDAGILKTVLREVLDSGDVDAVVTTGGTGIGPADVTIEAVRGMLDKELPGFTSLFMLLSYPQVKSAAMLSRALAGTVRDKAIFCLPGSPHGCRLATESLILPELCHILMLLRQGRGMNPCPPPQR